ncbi:hypothetical protein B0H16DRAFT_166159 [Mycena metata]|uniref:Uncharacterized protein n=1 Tax=Mycena metata TaxID=1033252 RepID=A0AAD7JYW9_9AGAR|nr:hypothetical protein B0H16DRAFT_166159 [Mycena metata]
MVLTLAQQLQNVIAFTFVAPAPPICRFQLWWHTSVADDPRTCYMPGRQCTPRYFGRRHHHSGCRARVGYPPNLGGVSRPPRSFFLSGRLPPTPLHIAPPRCEAAFDSPSLSYDCGAEDGFPGRLRGVCGQLSLPRTPCPDFSIFLNRQNKNAPAYALPIIATLRSLTFIACMTEITMPPSLMSCIPTLATQTPNLQWLTFRFRGDWECRRSVSVEPEADQALANHPSLREAYFIIETDLLNGSLARRVREQLPLSESTRLLAFLALVKERGRSNNFNEYFGDPASYEAENIFPLFDGYESPDNGDWSDDDY